MASGCLWSILLIFQWIGMFCVLIDDYLMVMIYALVNLVVTMTCLILNTNLSGYDINVSAGIHFLTACLALLFANAMEEQQNERIGHKLKE